LLIATRDSAIATLVERQTRYCQLVALPDETNAEPVCEAPGASNTTLPAQLRRSLTRDQGKEIAEHQRFSVETDVEVYLCDPRSPWQRGSNENTNGLLRQCDNSVMKRPPRQRRRAYPIGMDQTLRPNVAAYRVLSSPLILTSSTGESGRPRPTRAQLCLPFLSVKAPRSVAAYSVSRGWS
jgi:hypothetical protein